LIDAILFFGFLATLLAAGFWARRQRRAGLADYVLASRTLTLPLFVITLVPSFYGGVLGIGEFTWQHGLSNWLVMALPYYVFAGIYAAFLAQKIRLTPGLTIPDHLEACYGAGFAVFAALLVFLLSSPADELLMIGTLLSHFTGLGLPASMALGGALAMSLVLFAGLRSDVGANALQFVLMFAGFFLILPFAFKKIGPPTQMLALLPAAHRSLHGGLSPLQITGWWLIAVWTIVDPVFHQRCAAADSPKTARRGILLSIACWAVFDALTTTAGLYARARFPTLEHPLLAFPALADALLPPGIRGIFFAALSASLLAGLQARSLQASIALGKDAFGRRFGLSEARQEFFSRLCLALSLALGFALALWIPSVVGLWYAIGSAAIPGLLWPLVSVYNPRLRPQRQFAIAASVSGFAVSAAWVLWGRIGGSAPLGLEPMFPGLILSSIIWMAGIKRRDLLN
jgi:SSS family solute:Na+ symporter